MSFLYQDAGCIFNPKRFVLQLAIPRSKMQTTCTEQMKIRDINGILDIMDINGIAVYRRGNKNDNLDIGPGHQKYHGLHLDKILWLNGQFSPYIPSLECYCRTLISRGSIRKLFFISILLTQSSSIKYQTADEINCPCSCRRKEWKQRCSAEQDGD